MLRSLLAALLLAGCTAAYAQRIDCSKAKDPQRCEERLAKAKAAHAKARAACEGKKGDAGRECMRRELCAQTSDPARCEAQVKQYSAERARIREACQGKQGEELRTCIREQRQKK